MAWILLNIHRATEAMGRAAVFWCVVTLLQMARPALFQWLAYYILKNLLTQSHNVRQRNEDNH